MSKNPAQQTIEYGQSIWYDNISRELLDNGEIARLIEEWGVRGMTSNPSIFDQAISKGNFYDNALAELKGKGLTTDQVFEKLAIQDIGEAADLLRPLYDASGGDDGYVSIEVSPLLARDTAGTVEEAIRLYEKLDRPNIMIKIPGTKEGLPAVEQCLEKGISINITLLFSVANYVEVAEIYCRALKKRVEKGEPVDGIRSVASFFVSRVDTIVDNALQKVVDAGGDSASKAKELLGQFGIANCKLAYKEYQRIFGGEQFAPLKEKGAKPQRPLWASTSTKNPNYPDTLYVDSLIGPDTVNTVPHKTLAAFVDHGTAASTLEQELDQADKIEADIKAVGVDIAALMEQLQVEGVEKFAKSFQDLNANLEKKLG